MIKCREYPILVRRTKKRTQKCKSKIEQKRCSSSVSSWMGFAGTSRRAYKVHSFKLNDVALFLEQQNRKKTREEEKEKKTQENIIQQHCLHFFCLPIDFLHKNSTKKGHSLNFKVNRALTINKNQCKSDCTKQSHRLSNIHKKKETRIKK